MNQTRIGSLIEVWVNIVIGFGINFCANLLILPLFGFHPSLLQNLKIGLLFTVIAVARGYIIRRFFNARLHAMSQRLARSMS